jgi:hypothetical protein
VVVLALVAPVPSGDGGILGEARFFWKPCFNDHEKSPWRTRRMPL